MGVKSSPCGAEQTSMSASPAKLKRRPGDLGHRNIVEEGRGGGWPGEAGHGSGGGLAASADLLTPAATCRSAQPASLHPVETV